MKPSDADGFFIFYNRCLILLFKLLENNFKTSDIRLPPSAFYISCSYRFQYLNDEGAPEFRKGKIWPFSACLQKD